MSICDSDTLLDLNDAIALMEKSVNPVTTTEACPIEASTNRILAIDVYALNDIPNYDNSAMDGYALDSKSAEPNTPLKIVGEALAGQVFEGPINPGECVRITTGAKVPSHCDCVIMQEKTKKIDDFHIQILCNTTPGDNIRLAGNDVKKDSLVLTQGKRLTPIDIGMLASVGISEVTVFKKIRVATFSTGDELIPLGQELEEGQLHDSNRYFLNSVLTQMNYEVVDFGIIPDDPKAIETTFLKASSSCDAIISSGGVSVGDADFTKDILIKHGNIGFYKLAMKPGKPFAFGTINQAYFFGLPGNPVSSTVTFDQLTTPVLRQLSGEQFSKKADLSAQCISTLKKKPGRTDFQRGYLFEDSDGQLKVKTTGSQSSGALSSMVKANCYIVLEREQASVEEGETVKVRPFSHPLV